MLYFYCIIYTSIYEIITFDKVDLMKITDRYVILAIENYVLRLMCSSGTRILTFYVLSIWVVSRDSFKNSLAYANSLTVSLS